jgi:EAL domain-containing protein (putative c-di-GMP-specific phosphodiesterase class I)/GGDEF domain-containing protein
MVGWVAAASALATFGRHVMQPVEWFCSLVVGLVLSLTLAWLVRAAAAGDWDPVTGTLNRRGIGRLLAAHCAAAEVTGRPFAVATVRVRAAASGGRAPGVDVLAQRLAARWRSNADPRASWGRLTDLEFALVWDGSDGIEAYLERVREQAGDAVTAVGFCDWRPGVDATALLHDSFEGCGYSARTGGAVARAGLVQSQVAELRQAIEKGQVVPVFQPIVALPAGTVVGGEALARWRHPVRGMVPPDEFIPLAEHSGLIGLLGTRILRDACRAAADWRHANPDAIVAVNVSGLQLHDPSFPETVGAALRDAGLPPANLTIEVTESSLAADDAAAIAALDRLRVLGVTVSMDDFGTGYSSMARLAALPIDELKIDRSFVQQLERRRPLIECMVQLAATVGLRTVVEGVETAAQALAVTTMGADHAQGWLYGRPVPAADFPLAPRPAAVRG